MESLIQFPALRDVMIVIPDNQLTREELEPKMELAYTTRLHTCAEAIPKIKSRMACPMQVCPASSPQNLRCATIQAAHHEKSLLDVVE